MTLSGILDQSFPLYRRLFWQGVAIAAVVFVPLDLLSASAITALPLGAGIVWLLIGGSVVSIVGTFLVQGVLAEAIRDQRTGGRDSTLGDLYRRTRKRIASLIVAATLAGLGIAVGLVLFILPGLYLLSRWALIAPVVVIEDEGPGRAFSRSKDLTEGHRATVLGVTVVGLVLYLIAGGIPGGMVLALLPASLGDFVEAFAPNLPEQILFIPLLAVAWTTKYFELAGPEEAIARQPGLEEERAKPEPAALTPRQDRREQTGTAGRQANTAVVVVVWLGLGFLWTALLTVLGVLIHVAIGSLWLVSALALAGVVAWWMWRARRQPRTVATLACWWFAASLAGPPALVLALPWFRRPRNGSIELIGRAFAGEGATRRWKRAGTAFLWHALAAFSWLFFCGGLLVALALPNDGVAPSDLGLVLFGTVPAALWLVAAVVIVWRLRSPVRSATEASLPVAGIWGAVSAIAAFALAFSV